MILGQFYLGMAEPLINMAGRAEEVCFHSITVRAKQSYCNEVWPRVRRKSDRPFHFFAEIYYLRHKCILSIRTRILQSLLRSQGS